MITSLIPTLSNDQALALLGRLELWPQLLRRQQEELITAAVPLPEAWLEEQRQTFLAERPLQDLLAEKGWSEADLDLHLARPEALLRFARQRFGPGLEDRFLAARGGRDEVIYSLLRVRDAGLARELWIRLEEGETTFAEAASRYSEGPEAQRKGVMGPMPIGSLQPQQLQDLLRALRPGELSAPKALGEWHVLLRLEQLTPARFDEAMRKRMLQEALDEFLKDRVTTLLAGNADNLEPIHYDPES